MRPMTTTPDSFMLNDASSIIRGGKPKISVNSIKFKKPDVDTT